MNSNQPNPIELHQADEEEEFKEQTSPSPRQQTTLSKFDAKNSIPHLKESWEFGSLERMNNSQNGHKESRGGSNNSENFIKPGMLKQTYILIKKNFKVAMKKPNFLVSQFLGAVLTCLLIVFLNHLIRSNYEHGKPLIYKTRPVTNLEQCQFSKNCKSLGYIVLVSRIRFNSQNIEKSFFC